MIIEKRHLNMAKVGTKDIERFQMDGFLIEEDTYDTHLVATNGRTMLVYTVGRTGPNLSPGEQHRAVVSQPLIKETSKFLEAHKLVEVQLIKTSEQETPTIQLNNNTESLELESSAGRFPKWQDVLPDLAGDPKAVETCFNLDVLLTTLQAMKQVMKIRKGAADVTLRFKNGNSAIELEIKNGDEEILGVVMPMSSD